MQLEKQNPGQLELELEPDQIGEDGNITDAVSFNSFLCLQTCNQLEALVGPGSRKGPFGHGDSDTLSKTFQIEDQKLCSYKLDLKKILTASNMKTQAPASASVLHSFNIR